MLAVTTSPSSRPEQQDGGCPEFHNKMTYLLTLKPTQIEGISTRESLLHAGVYELLTL